MGREILYCSSCQSQLREADFGKGLAFRISNRACCAACAPELVRHLPANEMQELLKQMAGAGKAPPPSSRAISPVKTPRAPVKPAARKSSAPLLLAGAGAAVLVVVLILAVRGKPPPPSPPPAPPPAPAPKPSAEDAGRELLRAIAELDARVRPLTDREAYKDAAAVYEGARPRRDSPEWKALLDGKAADLRKEAGRRLDALLPQAEAARREGRAGEVAGLKTRVAAWGYPDLAAALDARLAAIPEPDLRPWEPLFDGRTTQVLNVGDRPSFKVENGELVRLAGSRSAGQSARVFEDGEIRVRFKFDSGSFLGISIRQSGKGMYAARFDAATLSTLPLKPHELVFRCEGDAVTATLDGRPLPVDAHGKSPHGHLQFNCPDGVLKILAVDFRPLR
jgi:hypothetical protein